MKVMSILPEAAKAHRRSKLYPLTPQQYPIGDPQ